MTDMTILHLLIALLFFILGFIASAHTTVQQSVEIALYNVRRKTKGSIS